MMEQLGYGHRIIMGGLIGGFGLSLLFVLMTCIFWRPAFGDGQYGMIFMFILPIGWIPGALVATAMALANDTVTKPGHPYLVAAAVVLCGTIVIPLAGTALILLLFAAVGGIMELAKR